MFLNLRKTVLFAICVLFCISGAPNAFGGVHGAYNDVQQSCTSLSSQQQACTSSSSSQQQSCTSSSQQSQEQAQTSVSTNSLSIGTPVAQGSDIAQSIPYHPQPLSIIFVSDDPNFVAPSIYYNIVDGTYVLNSINPNQYFHVFNVSPFVVSSSTGQGGSNTATAMDQNDSAIVMNQNDSAVVMNQNDSQHGQPVSTNDPMAAMRAQNAPAPSFWPVPSGTNENMPSLIREALSDNFPLQSEFPVSGQVASNPLNGAANIPVLNITDDSRNANNATTINANNVNAGVPGTSSQSYESNSAFSEPEFDINQIPHNTTQAQAPHNPNQIPHNVTQVPHSLNQIPYDYTQLAMALDQQDECVEQHCYKENIRIPQNKKGFLMKAFDFQLFTSSHNFGNLVSKDSIIFRKGLSRFCILMDEATKYALLCILAYLRDIKHDQIDEELFLWMGEVLEQFPFTEIVKARVRKLLLFYGPTDFTEYFENVKSTGSKGYLLVNEDKSSLPRFSKKLLLEFLVLHRIPFSNLNGELKIGSSSAVMTSEGDFRNWSSASENHQNFSSPSSKFLKSLDIWQDRRSATEDSSSFDSFSQNFTEVKMLCSPFNEIHNVSHDTRVQLLSLIGMIPGVKSIISAECENWFEDGFQRVIELVNLNNGLVGISNVHKDSGLIRFFTERSEREMIREMEMRMRRETRMERNRRMEMGWRMERNRIMEMERNSFMKGISIGRMLTRQITFLSVNFLTCTSAPDYNALLRFVNAFHRVTLEVSVPDRISLKFWPRPEGILQCNRPEGILQCNRPEDNMIRSYDLVRLFNRCKSICVEVPTLPEGTSREIISNDFFYPLSRNSPGPTIDQLTISDGTVTPDFLKNCPLGTGNGIHTVLLNQSLITPEMIEILKDFKIKTLIIEVTESPEKFRRWYNERVNRAKGMNERVEGMNRVSSNERVTVTSNERVTVTSNERVTVTSNERVSQAPHKNFKDEMHRTYVESAYRNIFTIASLENVMVKWSVPPSESNAPESDHLPESDSRDNINRDNRSDTNRDNNRSDTNDGLRWICHILNESLSGEGLNEPPQGDVISPSQPVVVVPSESSQMIHSNKRVIHSNKRVIVAIRKRCMFSSHSNMNREVAGDPEEAVEREATENPEEAMAMGSENPEEAMAIDNENPEEAMDGEVTENESEMTEPSNPKGLNNRSRSPPRNRSRSPPKKRSKETSRGNCAHGRDSSSPRGNCAHERDSSSPRGNCAHERDSSSPRGNCTQSHAHESSQSLHSSPSQSLHCEFYVCKELYPYDEGVLRSLDEPEACSASYRDEFL